jgi:site-specific DNA-cytosine methylase
MKKLTNRNVPPTTASPLVPQSRERPFTVSFRHKLERGYRFSDLQIKDLKDFQGFLDVISELTVSQVDARYKRKSDTADTVSGQQVVHYEASNSFRLHGVYLGGLFEVIRLDPNHRVHE